MSEHIIGLNHPMSDDEKIGKAQTHPGFDMSPEGLEHTLALAQLDLILQNLKLMINQGAQNLDMLYILKLDTEQKRADLVSEHITCTQISRWKQACFTTND